MSNLPPEIEKDAKQAEQFVFRTFETAWKDIVLRALLIVAGVLLVLALLHGCEAEDSAAKYQQQVKAWQQRAAVVVAENNSTNKKVDSLQKVSKSQGSKADSLTWVIRDIKLTQLNERKKNDSLLAVFQNMNVPDCQTVIDVALGYRKEADSLSAALEKADTRDVLRVSQINELNSSISLLKVSNDSLRAVIKTTPIYHPPKFLGFIPYPTRTQSFIGGIVVGILTTVTAVVHK